MPARKPDNDRVRRISFVSLGCPKNLVDSEKMLGVLRQSGFELVNEDQHPDAIVVNTCGFLEASKDESLEVIHDAVRRKEKGEIRRVVVAGCLVQRHRAKLLEWAPGIDAMVGVFDRDHIVDAVGGEGATEVAEKAPRYWIAGNALQAAAERGLRTAGRAIARSSRQRDHWAIERIASLPTRNRIAPERCGMRASRASTVSIV